MGYISGILALITALLISANVYLVKKSTRLEAKILQSKAKDPTTDTKELESKIDFLVYKLYHLTDDEIKIIEGK